MEKEYAKFLDDQKKHGGIIPTHSPVVLKPDPKPPIDIPADIIGKTVKHKTFGTGTITEIGTGTITVSFDKVGVKKMGYELCMKNKLLEFV